MSQVADLVPGVEDSLLPQPAAAQPAGWRPRLAGWVRRYGPALAVFGLALLLWEAAVRVLHIETFLLPAPSLIARSFVREAGVVFPAGLYTLRSAAGGFAMGCGLGLVAALLTARWPGVRQGVLPFAVAVNSTPIVALAPIMNNWFGITDPISKMSIVAMIVFFPVMINTVRGLTQVDPAALELMRSYAAGDLTSLGKVRVPNALPYLFSALKVASTLSVIGAIVSEYFGGPRQALGVYISQQAALFHFAEAWAAIIVACLLGIAFYGVILLAERLVMPWHVSMRAVEE